MVVQNDNYDIFKWYISGGVGWACKLLLNELLHSFSSSRSFLHRQARMNCVVCLRSSTSPRDFFSSYVSVGQIIFISWSVLLKVWCTCSVVWSSSPHGQTAVNANFSFLCMCVVSCSESHHYHMFWLAKKMVAILPVGWTNLGFDYSGLFPVCHICIWLPISGTFFCELACLFISWTSTIGRFQLKGHSAITRCGNLLFFRSLTLPFSATCTPLGSSDTRRLMKSIQLTYK